MLRLTKSKQVSLDQSDIMKRLKLLSALTLIALRLLATAASSSAQTTTSPSPGPTESARPLVQQRNKESEGGHLAPHASPAHLGQLHSTPSETPTSNSNDLIQRQLVAVEGKTANFTRWLVFVGALQVVAALLQFCASRSAASSAASSADAARAAVKIDAPYLLIQEARIFGLEPTVGLTSDTQAVIRVQNFGRGAAIVEAQPL
jgi:hypothetical protein